jgi:hypothetical protein
VRYLSRTPPLPGPVWHPLAVALRLHRAGRPWSSSAPPRTRTDGPVLLRSGSRTEIPEENRGNKIFNGEQEKVGANAVTLWGGRRRCRCSAPSQASSLPAARSPLPSRLAPSCPCPACAQKIQVPGREERRRGGEVSSVGRKADLGELTLLSPLHI